MRTDSDYWLAWQLAGGLSARLLAQCIQHFGSVQAVGTAPRVALQALKLNAKQCEALCNPPWHLVDKERYWQASSAHHHIITLADPQYPYPLRQVATPPIVLMVLGNLDILAQPQIAIVGSRQSTAYGRHQAEAFAYQLSNAGFAITSGLALGIDAHAHRGCLAAKGATIAVLGSGLSHCYPRQNKALFERIIAQNGAIVSQFPRPFKPHARQFPIRNYTISGLSQGVLVVQAALRSGSLITARCALEQGREVFAIPGSIQEPLARGCHHLLKQGAQLVETVDEIVQTIMPELSTPGMAATSGQSPALSKEAYELLQCMGYEAVTLEQLIAASQLSWSQCQSLLQPLLLAGCISQDGERYQRVVHITEQKQ